MKSNSANLYMAADVKGRAAELFFMRNQLYQSYYMTQWDLVMTPFTKERECNRMFRTILAAVALVLAGALCAFVAGCDDSEGGREQSTKQLAKDVTGRVSSMETTEFRKIKKGMSEEEVNSLFGLPTRNAGSGIAYTVYDTKTGDSIWIAWREGKTFGVFIRKPNGDEEKIIE